MNRTLFFVIALMAALAGCNEPRKVIAGSGGETTSVNVITAAQQQWPSAYEATGTVRSRTSTVISAKYMGYVREIHVNLGDHVREGQLLIALDARDLDAA